MSEKEKNIIRKLSLKKVITHMLGEISDLKKLERIYRFIQYVYLQK